MNTEEPVHSADPVGVSEERGAGRLLARARLRRQKNVRAQTLVINASSYGDRVNSFLCWLARHVENTRKREPKSAQRKEKRERERRGKSGKMKRRTVLQELPK